VNEKAIPESRKLLPRWLPFRVSAITGESHPLSSRQHSLESNHLQQLCALPKNSLTFGMAVDLLNSAVALGRPELGWPAVEVINAHEDFASAELIQMRDQVLGKEHIVHPTFELNAGELTKRDAIRDARNHLRVNHRNPIAWIDLARAYTAVGSCEKALHCAEKALLLDSDSRFIVRSVARLLIELKDTERAYSILRKSRLREVDPWIMAAETSIAGLLGKTPASVKKSRVLASSQQISPFHLSELHAALGQLEHESGAGKNARKHFAQALRSPTENSLAHVEFISHSFENFRVNPTDFSVPFAFEASAWDCKEHEDWSNLVDYCRKWQRFEPYGTRPVNLGSNVASNRLNNHALAYSITQEGLIASPGDAVLLNNSAYFLALQGKTTEADEIISALSGKSLSEATKACVTATKGLILIRNGDLLAGRQCYIEAISIATNAGKVRLAFRAASNLFIESETRNLPDKNESAHLFESLFAQASEADIAEHKSKVGHLKDSQAKNRLNSLA